jgi:hypothetical protein
MKKYAIILILLISVLSINAQQKSSFQETTALTKEVATRYFNHYMNLEWDKIESLMHKDITFDDPTAELAIGWQKVKNKDNVLKHFRINYAAITKMTPNLQRSFFSGNNAVFEMNLVFSFRSGKDQITTIKMPLVTILTLKDGKVITHKDFGDYTEYLKQIQPPKKKNE